VGECDLSKQKCRKRENEADLRSKNQDGVLLDWWLML
jgi:hypothetical protein